jgi:transcriptional regulator with XRE-family HTH domain
MKLIMALAQNLRAIRSAKQLTQGEVAERARVSIAYISLLEHGQRSPPLETIEALAKALSVAPLELLRPARGRRAA